MHTNPVILSPHQPRTEASFRHLRPEGKRPGVPLSGRTTPQANVLLAALPASTYLRICAHLEPVTLRAGEVLFEAGSTLRHVYFPTTAIISLMSETADGESTEIYAVGNEGIIGFTLFMMGETTYNRGVVIHAGQAYRLDSKLLTREIELSGLFLHTVLRYMQALVTQLTQAAVCNRHHAVEQRLCRRLLQCMDRASTSQLAMTHEQMANMLGVRRECITEWTGKLQAAGLIRCSRGRIAIVDRNGLEARACECYGNVKCEWDRWLQAA